MTGIDRTPRLNIVLALALACVGIILVWAALAAPPVAAGSIHRRSDARLLSPFLADADVFTITGIVQNNTGLPVNAVQVFAFSGPHQPVTYTNSAGHFTLVLSTGLFYDVVFNPPLGSYLASQFERGVHVSQFFSVTLPPGYAISGKVYRDAAKTMPVANTAIFAFNTTTYDGFGLPPSQAGGAYLVSLVSGTWELTFTPPPFTSLGPTRTLVALTMDITRDIVLPPGFTLYGQVITGAGGPQAGVEIFAQDPSQVPVGYGFTPTGLNGRYTGTLPSGVFDVQFFAPPFLGLGSTVITNVSGPADVELNLTLPAGFTVSGTVRHCATILGNSFVHAEPGMPVLGDDINGWGRFAGSDGFYTLALQSGTYTLTVSPPAGSNLPHLIVPSVAVTHDRTLNLNYPCLLRLPILVKP